MFSFIINCFKIAVLLGICLLIYLNFFAPPKKSRRFTSEGEFYLRKYVSVQTAHGIMGFDAGQLVRRVSADMKTGRVRVAAEGNEIIEVAAEDLTNDVDEAEGILAGVAQSMREWSDSADAARTTAEQAEGEINASYTDDVASIGAKMTQGGTVGNLADPFNPRYGREVYYSAPTSYVTINLPHAPTTPVAAASLRAQPIPPMTANSSHNPMPTAPDRINTHGLAPVTTWELQTSH